MQAIKSIMEVCVKSRNNTRMMLKRGGVPVTMKPTSRTREGYVNVPDLRVLVERGKMTEEQYTALVNKDSSSAQLVYAPTAAVQLSKETLKVYANFMADATMKEFGKKADLTTTEIEILDTIAPEWRRKKSVELVKQIMSVCEVSRSFLYRDHRKDGRKNKEKTFEKLSAELKDRVVKYYLSAKTRFKFVRDCLKDEALKGPSQRTWYRIASELEKDLKDELLLINKGALALRQATEPILRDKTILKPLQIIIGDFTRIDRIVKWWDNSLVTPYACVWLDWRTNMIVGVALTRHPNAIGAKTSLFNCFLNYGVPEIAFMDNGKEFKAYRVAGDKLETVNYRLDFTDELERDIRAFEYKGILPALGIRSMRAIVKNPRSKPVERTFGRGGFTDWAKGFHDWVGSKYWQMPETIGKAIAKYQQGKAYIEPLSHQVMPFTDMYSLAASVADFVHYHNNRPSEGFGMDGRSPLALYNELVVESPVRRASVQTLAFHFLEGDTRKVRNTGHIEFKKHFFYRADELWQHRGETVYIRFNPVDGFWWNRADKKQFEFLPKGLLVFDVDGEYLCEAKFVERQDPLNADVKTLMAKQRETASDARTNVKQLLASSVPSVPSLDVIEELKLLEEETNRRDAESAEKEEQRISKKFKLIDDL